jgi:ABC-type microcin C transport system permease subunit YejB
MSVLMLSTVPFMHKIGFNRGMVLGYTTMVLAFLLVFFGIRSYRENVGNGYISFGRALGVGLLIMLITCAFYVITWEFVYFNFMPDFTEKYGAFMLDNMRAAGASAQEIAAKAEEMKRFKVLYDNIFFNVAMTFLEPLPVGLIMTFVSAAILRKRRQGQQDGVKTTLVHQENPVNPV